MIQAQPTQSVETIAAFYQRHPYPPPVMSLDGYRQYYDTKRRRAAACLFWPHAKYRNDRRILVAGCGTSQAAKYALRWPHAQVIGIDVSTLGLEHNARLKSQHRIDNLTLHALAIEDVNQLEQDFEYIICTGVLHHLPDPERGLRALRTVLAPDGALYLMLYAAFGRAGISLLRDYCRRLGIGTSPAEIEALISSLQALPADHPLQPLLHNSPDFRREAGLIEALLHPQERSYSVPQIFELLAVAGLRFGRWLRQAMYLPCGDLATTPHQALLARLPLPEQYAAIELFRGSIMLHKLVAYHNNTPALAPLTKENEIWLDYVPLRLPDTLMVRDKLALTTAAAVLINRQHTYSDLYLPLDTEQKKMFDAIDDTRSIREIAGDPTQYEAARLLFQQLWDYDQVVFAAPTYNTISTDSVTPKGRK